MTAFVSMHASSGLVQPISVPPFKRSLIGIALAAGLTTHASVQAQTQPAADAMPASSQSAAMPSDATGSADTPRSDKPAPKKESAKTPSRVDQLDRVIITGTQEEGAAPNTSYTVRSTGSATKLDLAPKETPQSITTFTAQRIQDQGLLQLDEVLKHTTGVTLVSGGVAGAGRQPVYARTFPVRAVQMDGIMASSYILSGEDDKSIGMQDSFLYERIDVIRGSTSLTSGSGDPSASLNFVRKHPYRDRHLHAAIKAGSWDTRRGEVDFSTPLNERKSWRARIATAYQNGDHWVDRVSNHSKTLSLITALDINDSNRINLGMTHYDFKLRGASPHGITRFSQIDDAWPEEFKYPESKGKPRIWVYPTPDVERNFNNSTPWSRTHRRYTNFFASYEHDFSDDWLIKLGYNHANNVDDRLYGELGTRFYVPWADKANYIADRRHSQNIVNAFDAYLKGRVEMLGRPQQVVVGANYYDVHSKIYGGYAGNSSPVSSPDVLMFDCTWYDLCAEGPEYRRMQGYSISDWNKAGGNVPPAVWRSGGDMYTHKYISHLRQRQTGLYFSTHLQPLVRTHLIFGGRWARETEKPIYFTCHNGYVDPDCEKDKPYKATSNPDIRPKFLPYAGLVVELTPTFNAYASYTTAYIRDNNYDSNRHYRTRQWLPPIRGVTREVGLKGAFFDNRLDVAVSYFNMVQKDFPFYTMRDVIERTNNKGTAEGYRVRGYELSMAGEITPHWKISAGYVRQRQIAPDSYINYSMVDMTDFMASYRAPEKSLKLFTSYKLNPKITLGAGLRWQSATQSQWIPRYYTQSEKQLMKQDAFAIVDVMARYQFNPRLSLALNINNVFDKVYYQHERSYISGAPRNFLLTAAYKY